MKSHSKSRQKKPVSVGGHKSNKEFKQLAASAAILEIIEHDGLLGVTHSKVARKSKVSRAWIYEYIGKEKSALIEFAADVFGGHMTRVTLTELPKTKAALQAQLKDATGFLFDSAEKNPLIIKLYFRYRGTANAVGKVIQKYEKLWLKDAAATAADVLNLTPKQASDLAELIFTLRLGFAHRIATAANPSQARASGEGIFDQIHALV